MIESNKNIRRKMEEFDKKAKAFIKKMMIDADITPKELTLKLNDKGYDISENALRLKINRGRFDFAFLLVVSEVLGFAVEYK